MNILDVFRNIFPRAGRQKPPEFHPTLEQYEALDPAVTLEEGGKHIIYCTPNRMTQWRVASLYSKEPETLDWISTFQPNEVLLDIGANVGMYSIWSAITRDVRVYAFEPESQNYALLNKNIARNGLSHKVSAYCAALFDESTVSHLYLSSFSIGGSCHSFSQEVGFDLNKIRSPFAQGSISFTLDELVDRELIEPPDHIKIDVDGFEHKVIKGASKLFANNPPKSVLVEINQNLDEHMQLVSLLQDYGYHFSQEQVDAGVRTEGPFKGVANYVFRH